MDAIGIFLALVQSSTDAYPIEVEGTEITLIHATRNSANYSRKFGPGAQIKTEDASKVGHTVQAEPGLNPG